MSVEALWTIDFGAAGGAGSGVVVFETGKVVGGDSCFSYVGNFTSGGGRLDAVIRIRRHSSGLPSLYPDGSDDYEVAISADVAHDFIHGTIAREGFPDGALILRRHAELPG